MKTRYLRAEELARFAGVAKSTVLAAIRRGEIPSSRTVGRGTRIAVETARHYLESRGRSVPHELREQRATAIAVISEDASLLSRLRDHVHAGWSVSGSPRTYATLLAVGADAPAIVVVDLALTLMNPFDVIRGIRAARPATWIVAIGSQRPFGEAAVAAGASDSIDGADADALARAFSRRHVSESARART
jgi:excisionase family DNA binding protein